MRFNSLIVLPAIAMAFSGCIYYETDGSGHGCYEGDCAEGEGLERESEALLAFSPDHVEVGSSFIGYLTDELGETDMNTVVDVQFYGDVSAAGWDTRDNEVILSLTVDQAAVEGEVDIVVVFDDGATAWLDAAFAILPAGDRELDNDGQTDDGSGSGTDPDDCDE